MGRMAPGMMELTVFTCIFGGVVALTSVVYLVIVNRQYKKEKPKSDEQRR